MKILSVNISETKGTPKHPVDSIRLNSTGIAGDAHAGNWHRQISLLGIESFQKGFLDSPDGPKYGIYAENITLSGAPGKDVKMLKECNVGDRFKCGHVVLEVTQIGKKCHGDGCSVKQTAGLCVMPTDGIFAKVIHSGELKASDELAYIPRVWKTAVITLSTRASQGVYPDLSGPAVITMLEKFCSENHWPQENKYLLLPDDSMCLKAEIENLVAEGYDMIFTTGGTGFGPGDITTRTIKPMLEKEIPGIMEYIRVKYGAENPNALLSTSIAGIVGSSAIFCLPGSVRAVEEYFSEIARCLKHLDAMRMGQEH